MWKYQAIVIGASAGGISALRQVLAAFPAGFPLPVLIGQHLHPLQDSPVILFQSLACGLAIKEADEKEPVRPGWAYFAPPNYHLLVEKDHTLSLSVDAKVNYTRPSIDVLFESAADAYGWQLIGVILTGANQDGAQGLRLIQARGGLVMVQEPESAEAAFMPRAALQALAAPANYVLPLAEIGPQLAQLGFQTLAGDPANG
jgi:two-component system chemotaxis response regulator CheB